MRYYCKHCKSEITSDVDWRRHKEDCPICRYDRDYVRSLVKIPDYETPTQYEKRTGKKWPDNGAVWFKHRDGKPFFDSGIWGVCRYVTSKETGDKVIICAHTPEPPPDEWEPSEG